MGGLSSLTGSPGDTGAVIDRNVLGAELKPCGSDPVTGFYRDGCCHTGPEDRGSHTICAVATAEFLEHQRHIGNDLSTPMPEYHFPGLAPGDRWCVTAVNWLRAHEDGAAAYVVLASTHERALEVVPLAALQQRAVDVPGDPSILGERGGAGAFTPRKGRLPNRVACCRPACFCPGLKLGGRSADTDQKFGVSTLPRPHTKEP